MTGAVLDHLWQSTLLALGAGLLTAAFRKASARVRYGLWLAASLKFLVPFAALAALGRVLAPAGLFHAHAAPEAALIEKAARPLAQFPFAHSAALQAPLSPAAHVQAELVHAPTSLVAPQLDLGLVLVVVWALGSAAVLIAWAIRWARVHKVVRSAVPLAWPAPMPVLASPSLMEPGLVGLLRPVLVVPESLPAHLTRSEIDAILAHEISHLRRRDNLTAAIHMLVEALFWFHPMVWWIGARLIEERERACDEAVVAAGHDRAAYARGLVESCRLYLQSPLSCVAGASGSDLKTRVEAIMTAPATSPLSPLKKALLLAAGACAVATPVTAGLLSSQGVQNALARTSGARALAGPVARPIQDVAPEEKATVLARNEAVLAPSLVVARMDTPQTPLSREVATPPAVAPEPSPGPQPVQLAAKTPRPTQPSPTPTFQDPAKAAADFVKSYSGVKDNRAIGRWTRPICVRVVGLTEEEDAAVKARIEEVAAAAGASKDQPTAVFTRGKAAGSAIPGSQFAPGAVTGSHITVDDTDCRSSNVEIGFTPDPQAMLNEVIRTKSYTLGDLSSDTRKVKTVSLPIQAWYMTNGETFARNNRDAAGGLKVEVVWQSTIPGTTGADGRAFGDAPGGSGGGGDGYSFGGNYGSYGGFGGGPSGGRQFLNVFMVVDLRKVGGQSLGLLADYVTMLALSQPHDLTQCDAEPSVTDLFLNCGRPAPDGLTPADAAYLTALYSSKGSRIESSKQSDVVRRMANILTGDKLASR